MRASVIFAIISALSVTALAVPAPAPETDVAPENVPEDTPDVPLEAPESDVAGDDDQGDELGSILQKRGWGCNAYWFDDDEECHQHCKSIKGYKGGYCKWSSVCKCY